jgi:ABC-type glycerol-3-phosphate transport system substrate-binding protein
MLSEGPFGWGKEIEKQKDQRCWYKKKKSWLTASSLVDFLEGEKKMKKLAMIAGAVLIIAVCFACKVQNKEQASSSPAASTVAGKPYSGKKLTVLYMSSTYADAARLVANQFKELTGADVEVVDFPYVTLHEKELLDISSNTGAYDVIDVACQWDGEFAPFLEDLKPYVTRDNYDTSDIIEGVASQAGIWNGILSGIPNACTPMTIAYRTDLIKPEELPKTWDEYLALAKKHTDPSKGLYGVAIPGVAEQFGGLYYIRLWSMGGAWADENWKTAIDSPEARKALEHVKELLKYADPASLSWGLNEPINAFLQGNAAMCEAWPTLGILGVGDDPAQSKIVGKYALATFPYEKNGITNLSAWDLSIPKGSQNKDLAWEWIKFYTSLDNQNTFYKEYSIFSPRKSFFGQSSIKSPNMDVQRKALDTAIIWWRIPASVEAELNLGRAVNAYMSGQQNMETTIKYMKDAIENALALSPPPAGVKNLNR